VRVNAELTEIAEELLKKTAAGRTTVRLLDDTPGEFPVVAEAVAPGVQSLKGQPVVRRPSDNPGPLEYLESTKQLLAQEDVTTSPPVFPEIIDVYGVRAQMLAPILDGDEFIGLVSVHSIEPRAWTKENIDALSAAALLVAELVSRDE
jgi:maleate isomerase